MYLRLTGGQTHDDETTSVYHIILFSHRRKRFPGIDVDYESTRVNDVVVKLQRQTTATT